MASQSAAMPTEACSDTGNSTNAVSLDDRAGGGRLIRNPLKAIFQILHAAAEAKQMAIQAHRKWPALGE